MQIRFASFVFDTGARELTAGGREVPLSPKALRLLELLLEAAPEAISHDALYAQIWGDVFVQKANLPNLVSEVRAALGDAEHALIRTVHRFGYRWDAAVERSISPAFALSRASLIWGTRTYLLREGSNLVGRDAAADVQIDVAGVSRRHATITLAGDSAMIEDHASKNGTFVHGARIESPANIEHGETVRFGSASVVFHLRSFDSTTVTDLAASHGAEARA